MSLYTIEAAKPWKQFREDKQAQSALLEMLPSVMKSARWFGGKGYAIKEVKCDHCLPIEWNQITFYFFIVEVLYEEHGPEYYMIPLALTATEKSTTLAQWKSNTEHAFVSDACYEESFHRALFEKVLKGGNESAVNGTFAFDRGKTIAADEAYVSSRNPGLDQSNSSIFFNEKYFMKIYRKLFRETNPEVEMLKFLSETGGYTNVPAYAGSLIWERSRIAPVTLALMMGKVDAQKDNWVSTGDELNDFLRSFIEGDFSIHEFVFEHVELLAKRTAEMHLALYSTTKEKLFKHEKFTPAYREWLYIHLTNLLEGRLEMLQQNRHKLDEEALRMADKLKRKQKLVQRFFEQIKTKPLKSLRTRIHGDYHLGQILFYNQDYIIIDFEGEPESSIAERKIKHSPMKDVAGMIRSFHYAVSAKLFFSKETSGVDTERLQKAADRWFYLIRDTFWETYYKTIGKENGLYYSKAEINFLFLLHLLEKAIYEIGYELNGRPDWLKIPLKGIEQVINELEKYEE